jgi:hypothetical protein
MEDLDKKETIWDILFEIIMNKKYKLAWLLALLVLFGFYGYCVIYFVETIKSINATDFEKTLIIILFYWIVNKFMKRIKNKFKT